MADDVDLDHVANVLFARFSHCEVPFSPFPYWTLRKRTTPQWEGKDSASHPAGSSGYATIWNSSVRRTFLFPPLFIQ